MIRGCDNNKTAIAENPILHKQLDSVLKKKISDIIAAKKALDDYEMKDQLRDAQISIVENRNAALNDSLNKASDRIADLQRRYKPVKPSTDTSVTVVPNEYVNNCADCFAELSNDKALVMRANAQKDSLKNQYLQKISEKDNRINELGNQNKNLQATLTDAFEIAKKEEQEFAPKRVLYFSLSTLIWNGPLPRAVGAGFIYQDKRKRQYEAKAYGSNIGMIYEGGIAVPLSLNSR